jgi:hypothetical protein
MASSAADKGAAEKGAGPSKSFLAERSAQVDRSKWFKPLELKMARSDGQGYEYDDPDDRTNSRPCTSDEADQKWRVNLANYLKAQLQPGEGDSAYPAPRAPCSPDRVLAMLTRSRQTRTTS